MMSKDPPSILDKDVKESGGFRESTENKSTSIVSGNKKGANKKKSKLSSPDAEKKRKSQSFNPDQEKKTKHRESSARQTLQSTKGKKKKVVVDIRSDTGKTDSADKKIPKILSATSRKFKSVADISRVPRTSTITSSESSEISEDEDIMTITLPETTQRIIHCSIGENLFVDKTWCTVKKADILEDVTIQESNSPFSDIVYKIRAYKPDEFLVGYEPFERRSDEFIICITEKGRDDVLRKLETEKENYLNIINKSKSITPRSWVSLGSEMEVDDFQIRNKRDLINFEWTGDIAERIHHPGIFDDCNADSLKNGYICLLPDKTLYKTNIRSKLDRDVQAAPATREMGVDTDIEVVTATAIQCDAEVDLKDLQEQLDVSDESVAAFLNKHLDKILDEVSYNEIYDLYQDDYLALRVNADTDVHKYDAYKQYQSFTDVTAVEGKLVIDTSWHPTYTGIVAVAYASEIPCMMKELEYDSDQTDYEEEKSDEDDSEETSVEQLDDSGAKQWLEEERRERDREYTETNTDRYDKAVKRLKEVEKYKAVWDAKMHDEGNCVYKRRETVSEPSEEAVFNYVIYQEPPETVKKSIQVTESSANIDLTEEVEANEIPEDEDQIPVEDQEEVLSEVDTRQTENTESTEDSEQDIKVSVSMQKSSQSILVPPIHERNSTDSYLSEVVTQATDYIFNDDDENSYFSQGTEMSSATGSLRGDFQQKPSLTKKKKQLQGSILKSTLKKKIQDKRKKQVQIEESVATEIDTVESEMESFEEMSDDGTGEADVRGEKLPPLLVSHNPVLIWSFVNDLSPKLILESPHDVTCIQFSMHDGNYIAGGTTSGQVVLWDITGRIEAVEKPEELTSDQQKYRKIMEDMMSWRYDIRSKRRVKVSGICSHMDSHMGKINSIQWVDPTVVVTNTGQMIPHPDEAGLSMCVFTSSVTGRIKFWNIDVSKCMKQHKRRGKTKSRFERPLSLDLDITPVQKLYRTWSPFLTLLIGTLQMPVMVSGIHKVIGKRIMYERVTPLNSAIKQTLEDRIHFTPVISRMYTHVSQHVYGSTVFGDVGNITWQSPEQAPLSKIINTHAWWWHSVHDGPVTRISQHYFIPELCLSVGGHVFAVWHTHNKENPMMTKRYYGVYITDGIWSPLRPSLIRIARSDGVVEIWDMMIQSHAPATTIIISGQIITNLSSPVLPEVQGLMGIADYNSAFRLFCVPDQFGMWTPYELDRLKQFVHREPGRQQMMQEWSKWWQGSHLNVERDEKRKMRQKEKEEKDELIEKEKQEEARKKYNEEVYQWYMRRRGKVFTWKEEAEERLQARQEEYVHELPQQLQVSKVIQVKKKIDRAQMEVLMRPLIREEKNIAQKHEKAQARIKQADAIFRATVNTIFPKASKEDRSKSIDTTMEGIYEIIEYYFGENFDILAEDQLDFIRRSPWHFDSSEILDKYDHFRVLFNDRRRKRNKALRWLRKKLREELIQAGYKIHIRRSHKDRYKYKKIKRREENMEWLRNMYGDDYNVYWDVVQPCRRFSDRKFRFTAADLSSGPSSVLDTSHLTDDVYQQEEDLQVITYGEKKVLSIREESMLMDTGSKEWSVDKELKESKTSSIQLLKESVSSKIDSKESAVLSVREPESPKEIMSLSEIKPVPSPLTVDRLTASITDVVYTTGYDDNLMNELDYISQPVTQSGQVTRPTTSQTIERPVLALQQDDGVDEYDEAEFTDEEDKGEYEWEEEHWEDMFPELVEEDLEELEEMEEEYDGIGEEREEEGKEVDGIETAERILEVAEERAEQIEEETDIVLTENDNV